MTHPNHQTNGASLEDCHTNFFALTDLCGIKWRKLVWGDGFSPEPMEDPVLSSFSRCLAGDILCVWRRVGSSQQPPASAGLFDTILPTPAGPVHPPLSLHSAKELWIFWYGEEPDLTNLVSPELLQVEGGDQGSWENGLSYECRSLLFKALHNLIERCLLSRDFVRLGKWFVQPYDGSQMLEKSGHLSFSFAFFVHGESTVCASVDVRQHPPVRCLLRPHLQQAQACMHTGTGVQVILAPYGLAGTLTGQSFKATDPGTNRILEDWRHFYPLDVSPQNDLPPAVEVVVGGVKMRYPSCYVLVTDLDETTATLMQSSPPATGIKASSTPTTSLNQKLLNGSVTVSVVPQHQHHPDCMAHMPTPASVLPERVWEDSTLGVPEQQQQQSQQTNQQQQQSQTNQTQSQSQDNNQQQNQVQQSSNSSSTTAASTNPQQQTTQQQTQQQQQTPSNQPSTQQQQSQQSQQSQNQSQQPGQQTPATEATNTTPPILGQWDFQDPTKKQTCSCSKCRKGSGGLPGGGGWKGPRIRIPFHKRPSAMAPGQPNDEGAASPLNRLVTSNYNMQSTPHHQNDSLPVPSVGSPPSVAPSPLPNPHSVPQPASVPPPDPIMPTLSPQPPPPHHHHPPNRSPLEDKIVCTPSDFHQPKSASSVSNQVFSPYPLALSVEASKPLDSVGGPGSVAPPPSSGGPPPPPPPTHDPPPPTLKRPVLTSREYETALQEEDQPSELLYDYTTLNAWLNHPVKRFKPNELKPEPNRLPPYNSNSYNTSQSVPSPPQVYIKQEPGINMHMMEVDGSSVPMPNIACKRSDPYEFDDDGMVPPVTMESFKRAPAPVKEEEKKNGFETATVNGPKCPTTPTTTTPTNNLFATDSLGVQQTTFKEEPGFENSDDTSSDETLQVQTPPGSNKASDECGGSTLLVRPPRGSGGQSSILRPEELSKMFPTPPSLEHNPIASPCGGQLSDTPLADVPDYMPLVPTRVRQDIYPNMGSPQEEPIEDWTFVFQPPRSWKFVGSTKYAPLTNLPSQSHPPVTLPSHCVYKPSWMFSSHQHHQEKPSQGHMSNMITGVTVRPSHPPPHPHTGIHPHPMMPMHPRAGLSPISPYPQSPMTMNWRQQCPPYSPPPVSKPQVGRPPEANSLIVNILLGDTALNIFRDHNFDSCTLCVCNATPKCVGNIRGADAAVYLPQPGMPLSPYPPFSPNHHPPEEDSIRCNCGFSAVVNRRLSHRSGLFFEDELEITGLNDESTEHTNSAGAALGVMDLVRQQCVVVHSLSSSLYRAARQYRPMSAPATLNILEFTDGNQVTFAALEQGRQAHLQATHVAMCKVEEMAARQQAAALGTGSGCGPLGVKSPAIHRWGFLRARGPRCNQDIVRIMKTLQPLLQDAIQKKCTTRLWEAPYTVSGPLTWRQFHRLAGRGTDDRCEPQPIPALVVGHEKDWLSLAPYALQYWEKLLLEPYSYARDIAYVVVAPDNDYVLQRVRTFFKELSSTYEVCRLGRHCPITKVLRDGILRVGKTAAVKLSKEPVDEWFTMLGENSTTNMLKLYAQVCRHHLAPHLSQVPMDRTLLDPPEGSAPRPTPSPMPPPPPSTPEDKAPSTPKATDSQGSDKPSNNSNSNSGNTPEDGRNSTEPIGIGSSGIGVGEFGHDEEDTEPPAIVVYLVEPFTFGSDDPELQRLACLGLLRCFNTVQANIPDNIRANITLQIISLESILELGRSGDRKRRSDHMRALALSVFSQCRRQLQHSSNVKALTGFGTAACTDLFLKGKDEKNRAPYRVYTPPYVLARGREKMGGGGGGECSDTLTAGSDTPCSVLYVSYCLSENQHWLLATATDEQGVILEKATVNIHIPNRTRRRKASARRVGLQKLMDFILGVMSKSVTPWRLVVGRVGRIGHGELKGWSWLLSRKSLLKASKHLKEICGQCSLLYPHDMPCILSACLVSMEPDSALRMMPDQFTPDERFSQMSVKCQLSTPQDVTCTHILVFPTSATTQSSQTAFQEQHINGPELGDEELFKALNDDMPDGMGDFNDIFTWPDTEAGGVRSPTGSPRARGGDSSHPGSPSCLPGQDDHHSPFPCNGPSRGGEALEEVGTLLQQPLALGYLVSTAPTGRMPRWFWSACPHLETVCPAFLKNALHLHSTAIQQNSDELLQQQSASAGHPLDSQYTTDVLRYVLEGYNALSWLALDSNTHDRLSCLPVHMQVLMQLYHMTSAFV